jgi:uncharacterized protein YgbK (DUF1537 family)
LTLLQRLNNDQRRVVILDDDPTGTQTVSGVILQPNVIAYKEFFKGSGRVVYVLTNSRAMPQEEAIPYIEKIRQEVLLAAEEAQERVAFGLRGDST